LTLSAPLSLNSNVHGTAFAGSLYSVGCLASYYILRYWMRLQPGFEDMGLHLVARGGSVEYLRPVKGDIVAVSTLPDKEEMGQFTEAVEQGKGFVKVRGVVRLEDGIGKGEIVREGEVRRRLE
jgi:thioesterase domain-containing protein